jgi:2-polyprenyl-3-methyl-5-hydroxy-6-metoxy-1,4-benzoquinol methylase
LRFVQYFSRYISGKRHAPFYFRNLFFDPPQIKSSDWFKEVKQTQLRGKAPLFLDRQFEICEFFNKRNFGLFIRFLKYGFPNTDKFKLYLMNFFENNTSRNDLLKMAYEKASFPYALRLMLGYERYSTITPYLDSIIEALGKPIDEFSVLDYGCRCSDMGLLLASLGAEVTIADLDDEKFQ